MEVVKMKKLIYMDNAATTRVHPDVLSAMLPFYQEEYGNPSSLYSFANGAKNAIEQAREKVATAIGAQKNEIYFTACGTESDNWAVKGCAYANRSRGKHIITTAIEHHAILHTMKTLEKEGFEVTYLPVDEYGIISIEDFKNAIRPDTILVSIMYANNEIGAVEPVAEIGKICHEKKIYFHTDAVQAVGHLRIDVNELGVDMLSASAHKFYGPKGIGFLYIRRGVRIQNFMDGGAQERGKRAGTENVAEIVGMGRAIELVYTDFEEKTARIAKLRDRLIDGILKTIPYTRLNGPRENRLCNNVNISFRYIEGESILLMLDLRGIAASSGSACATGSLDPSHVLLGIGLPHEIAHGSIRLSLGEFSTEEEVDTVIVALREIVQRLREMSPLYEGVEGR
jgi:cysteine desulfurase